MNALTGVHRAISESTSGKTPASATKSSATGGSHQEKKIVNSDTNLSKDRAKTETDNGRGGSSKLKWPRLDIRKPITKVKARSRSSQGQAK